jgi:hypothetical protein
LQQQRAGLRLPSLHLSREDHNLLNGNTFLTRSLLQGKEGELIADEDTCVNFAYSVTALHHCCVIECVIADVPASLAFNVLPTFVLHGGRAN